VSVPRVGRVELSTSTGEGAGAGDMAGLEAGDRAYPISYLQYVTKM
jgi:hypothetical protein